MAFNLEKDIYIQEQTISSLIAFADALGVKKDILFPTKYKEESLKGRGAAFAINVANIVYLLMGFSKTAGMMTTKVYPLLIVCVVSFIIGEIVDEYYKKKNKILVESNRKLIIEDNIRVEKELEQRRYIY